MTATAERRLGEARGYDDFIAVLRARKDELNISCETLDAICGFTRGHSSKILAPLPSEYGKRPTNRGIGRKSMGELIGGLAVKLIVAEDADALTRIKTRLTQRDNGKVNGGMLAMPSIKRIATWLFHPRKAKRTRAEQVRTQSKAQRSQIARNAAEARWRNRKKNGAQLEARLAKAINKSRNEKPNQAGEKR